MPTVTHRPRLEKALRQRCFLLFLALLALLVALPFLSETVHGRELIGFLNVVVLVTAVAAVESSGLSLAVAILLGVPLSDAK